MNIVLRGTAGILGSRKACMCLVIIAATVVLAFYGKLTTEVAAIMTVVGTIYMHTQSKADINATNNPNCPPQGSQ